MNLGSFVEPGDRNRFAKQSILLKEGVYTSAYDGNRATIGSRMYKRGKLFILTGAEYREKITEHWWYLET